MTIRPNKLFRAVFAAILFLAALPAVKAGDAYDVTDLRLRTVVIDAGHGGHDPGAVSASGKVRESEINLDVALSLGRLIRKAHPDVNVVYTRETDVFIPLAERANIANRNHADLFISIHVNAAKRTGACGTESFVMGTDKSESNMAVCRQENAVILMEDDYSATYQGFDPNNVESYIFFNLMQNAHFEQSIAMASLVQQNLKQGPISKSRGVKQAPLMVLWRTTMPSVLVEIGFISNLDDLKVLSDPHKRKDIAASIFAAFESYKEQYDSHKGFKFEDQFVSEDDLVPLDSLPEDQATVTASHNPDEKPKVVDRPKVEEKPVAVEKPKVEEKPVVVEKPKAEEKPVAVEKPKAEEKPVVVEKPEPEEKPVVVEKPEPVDNVKYFRIQIFTSNKVLKKDSPEFKGLKDCDCTLINGVYKYTYGRYATRAEANAEMSRVRAKFSGAFITCF